MRALIERLLAYVKQFEPADAAEMEARYLLIREAQDTLRRADSLEPPPLTAEAIQRIHAICAAIRGDRWAGIDEREVDCRKCAPAIDTRHGTGTRGCFLIASRVYDLAHGWKPRRLT
jgi:hypothetical protein